MRSLKYFSIVFIALVFTALPTVAAACVEPVLSPYGNGERAAAPAGEVIDNQWIVTVSPQAVTPEEAAGQATEKTGGSVSSVYTHALNGFAIKGASKVQLERLPGVVSVEPDRVMHAFEQTLPTGVDRIKADTNSIAGIDGIDERVDVDIAVIDTGIDLDHVDLNVFSGVDCTRGPSCRSGGNANDGNGHGTHVAGSAAALDNSIGAVGTAPGARLWAVKVLGDDGSGSLSEIIAGIDYVTANASEIEVANLSLGGQGVSEAFHTAIKNSVDAGVYYAVAAGNDSVDVYGDDGTFCTSDDIIPAAYPEVATISALSDTDGEAGGVGPLSSWGGEDRNNDGIDDGEDDSFAFFSNFSRSATSTNPVTSNGAAIDLLLPGVDIFSTYKNGNYNTMSGTSMASPHGAGLAALEIAKNGRDADGDSDIDANDVYTLRQTLIDSGVGQDSADGLEFLNDPDDNREYIGWAASGAPSVSITSPGDGAIVSGTTTIEADASDSDGSVTQVEFFVDGSSVGTDTDSSDGWSTEWNTADYSEGDHTITVEATDDDNNVSADTISVSVNNNAAPLVEVTSPSDGATVSGTVDVTASSTDEDGAVSQVEFFADGNSIGIDSDSSDGWNITWDSTTVSDGDHTITAEATDKDGESSSHSITVTVDNVSESSPVVESLSLDESSSGGSPHVEFMASWSVSDDDANLDTVSLTLRDLSTGTVEDSDSLEISGGSASGSNTLRAKHDEGSAHEYELELVVADANGNTAASTTTKVEDGS